MRKIFNCYATLALFVFAVFLFTAPSLMALPYSQGSTPIPSLNISKPIVWWFALLGIVASFPIAFPFWGSILSSRKTTASQSSSPVDPESQKKLRQELLEKEINILRELRILELEAEIKSIRTKRLTALEKELLSTKSQVLDQMIIAIQEQLQADFTARFQKMQEEYEQTKEIEIRNAQEKEWELIAQSIHDQLNGKLTTIKRYMEVLTEKIETAVSPPEELTWDVQGLIRRVEEIDRSLREWSYKLMPVVLLKEGLNEALSDLTAKQTVWSGDTEVCFEAIWYGDRLDPKLEKHLYRFAQEGITNALKYANADNIIVSLHRKLKEVRLIIHDDGCGMDTKKLDDPQMDRIENRGLISIKNQVKTMNGECSISSRVGRFTRITITIPTGHQTA